ncbi:RagB/SusD family nutrient uptake outer membrane protein [Tamlana sp. 1_MG-2023]|uniref:RagB/SusD family nutrient uptake outer membrane protein n=1 Tax=Tamlana sp. 1_MG-2023 TaxID=3062628 RepID=UPI0026E12832|nr:RagB/SusD family nutrient uptake outer membrane protein [Tamlana sp. 1_MG-2023]MDO6792070.1 RagB/SusD family nutrient uptake outer membrane protein [Tamlana sp. 1_MG-2023]
MKNRYIIIAFMTLLFGMTVGCDDYLEEDAKGTLTPDSFFENEAEANLALNGLQDDVIASGLIQHLGTDIGLTGRFAIAGGWLVALYDYNSSTAQVRTTWSDAYTGVRNANLVLSGLESSNLSAEVKGNATAQAKFYRAFQYLDLIRNFGDVPYWRDEVNIAEVSLLGKTDADVIGAEMIADLEDAINSGYLSTSTWQGNGGRPTVWAVRMLKAYYHVWFNEWAQARTELIAITANSPHVMSDDYADMYREGNELNDELIFGKEFLAGINNNQDHNQAHFNSNGENEETRDAMAETNVFARAASMCMRKSFANTYDDNDKRKLYNVWDSHTLKDGTVAEFNYVYLPKLLRAAVPISDPLMETPDPNGQSSQPARIFRLSDAYLLLAEAEFMLNGSSAEALAAINYKRAERVGLPDYTAITIQDIRNERGWELAGEGFWGRKFDLIRWGILESTVISMPAAEAAAGSIPLTIERTQEEADRISAGPVGKFQIFPIPLEDLLISQDIGGALTQNPLWVD